MTAYFSYPAEIRRLIYTTNTIEGYHRQLRKVTKTKTAYPTDDSLRKIIYLATMEISKKWTIPVRGWKNVYHNWPFIMGIDWKLSFQPDRSVVPA